jgi:hypothetical protein
MDTSDDPTIDLLIESMEEESLRFEHAVAGEPFLPDASADATLLAFGAFTDHVNRILGGNHQHLCVMTAATRQEIQPAFFIYRNDADSCSESGNAYSTGDLMRDVIDWLRADAASSSSAFLHIRIPYILPLSDVLLCKYGVFETQQTLSRLHGTTGLNDFITDWRAQKHGWAREYLRCDALVWKRDAATEKASAAFSSIGGQFVAVYVGIPLSDGATVNPKPDKLRILNALFMRFQREWCHREKERQVTLRKKQSFDMAMKVLGHELTRRFQEAGILALRFQRDPMTIAERRPIAERLDIAVQALNMHHLYTTAPSDRQKWNCSPPHKWLATTIRTLNDHALEIVSCQARDCSLLPSLQFLLWDASHDKWFPVPIAEVRKPSAPALPFLTPESPAAALALLGFSELLRNAIKSIYDDIPNVPSTLRLKVTGQKNTIHAEVYNPFRKDRLSELKSSESVRNIREFEQAFFDGRSLPSVTTSMAYLTDNADGLDEGNVWVCGAWQCKIEGSIHGR